MKHFYWVLICLFICQGCGSIQRMRYSNGFHIHFEGWGKEELQANTHLKKSHSPKLPDTTQRHFPSANGIHIIKSETHAVTQIISLPSTLHSKTGSFSGYPLQATFYPSAKKQAVISNRDTTSNSAAAWGFTFSLIGLLASIIVLASEAYAGFVFLVILALLCLILSGIGLGQSIKKKQKARGFAIAGLIIGTINAIVAFFTWLTYYIQTYFKL
jgi:hypothetical protein